MANFDAMSLALQYGHEDYADSGMTSDTTIGQGFPPEWIEPALIDYKTAAYRTKHRELFAALDEKRARKRNSVVSALAPKPLILNRNVPARLALIPVPKPFEPGEQFNPGYSILGSARSRLLHPGGGLIGSPIGPQVDLMRRRCPAGYEHGGRFTNRALGNCGALLFDIFDGPGGASIIGPLRSVRNATNNRNIGRAIGEGQYLNDPSITRKPQIPDLGIPNKTRQSEVVQSLVQRLGDNAGKEQSVFVRSDGVSMLPKATIGKIARSRANKDIMDGVMVVRAPKVDRIGGEEVSLLGSGARSVVYVMPGKKGTITLARTGDFTSSQAGAMRRRLGGLSRKPGMSGAERLRALADTTPNLTYSEVFDGIENPSQLVRIALNGKKQTSKLVPRWLYEIYLAGAAPGRDAASSWSIIESSPA